MSLRYRILKEVRFEASHQLFGLSEGHKCARRHGHSYRVIMTLESGSLDETGFVIDFGIISGAVKQLYDHQDLNEVMGKKHNPTAEILAKQIFELISGILFKLDYHTEVKVTAVKVFETESSMAEVFDVPQVG